VRRAVAWLHGELPVLVERGVLTAEAADALRRHYGTPDRGDARWGQILLASFGALLVGGGIILILAHNWDNLGRPARAAIALGTLAAAQALTLYAAVRQSSSDAWREASAGLLVAAVGAAIGLVGQTYHAGGTFEDLLRWWLWLIVPVPYLTGSVLSSLGLWAVLAARSFGALPRGTPGDLWILVFAAAPFVVVQARRQPDSWSAALLTIVASAATFVVGSMVTLDRWMEAFWAVFQVTFVAALVAAATWPSGDGGPALSEAEGRVEGWRRRLRAPAWLVLILLGTILSFDGPWRSIARRSGEFPDLNLAITMTVALACVVFASIATMRLTKAGSTASAAATAAAPLVVLLYAMALAGLHEAGWVVFSLWLLVVGVLTLAEGIRRVELGTANRGLIAVSALVVARFFDTDVSFLLRGLAFVALGLACFALNLWLVWRSRRQTA
jgi:uncharacterized membrane protein